MDEKIIEDALRAITVLNKEMGATLEAISRIKSIIFWGFSILTGLISATLVAVMGKKVKRGRFYFLDIQE